MPFQQIHEIVHNIAENLNYTPPIPQFMSPVHQFLNVATEILPVQVLKTESANLENDIPRRPVIPK